MMNQIFGMSNPFQYNPMPPSMPFMADYNRPVPQTPPVQSSNVNWIYVNGYDGAKANIVQPGQTAWMMDNNDPIFYVKSVDTMGSATLKSFGFSEINPVNSTPAPTAPDLSNYVQKTDMDAVVERLKAVEDVIGGLNA